MSLTKQVEGLVLRKFDYSETSLIFVLLTKESGQLRFILKGARKGSKRKFPAIDLFRRVTIQFVHKPATELHTVRSCELVESFDAVAHRPPAYRAAVWLCRYMERNTMPEEPCAEQYAATVAAFARLMGGDAPLAVCTATMAVSLEEHGLLPDLATMPERRDAMAYLLACAIERERPLPNYDRKDWENLFRWAVSQARDGELYVPDTDRLT